MWTKRDWIRVERMLTEVAKDMGLKLTLEWKTNEGFDCAEVTINSAIVMWVGYDVPIRSIIGTRPSVRKTGGLRVWHWVTHPATRRHPEEREDVTDYEGVAISTAILTIIRMLAEDSINRVNQATTGD